MALTPQQIADAAAKRRATQAANRAAGIPTVRQQRAAAKAAKAAKAAGQPAPPPPPPSNSTHQGTAQSRRRRRSHSFTSPSSPRPSTPSGPVFAPKPNYRALKLAAMAALEAAFVQKLEDAGGVAALTDETRTAFSRYKAAKARALATTSSATATAAQQLATRNEDDAALLVATIALVKLAY